MDNSFFALPTEVYSVLLEYLPDQAVARLSITSKDTRRRVSVITREHAYWSHKLRSLVEEHTQKATSYSINLRGVKADEMYKDAVRMTGYPDEIIFLMYELIDMRGSYLEIDQILLLAIKLNLSGVVKYMTDIDLTDYQKLFEYAVDSWLEASATCLLDTYSIDPSYDNDHALIYSSTNRLGYLLIRLLEDKRVDPRAQNGAALANAADNDIATLIEKAMQER